MQILSKLVKGLFQYAGNSSLENIIQGPGYSQKKNGSETGAVFYMHSLRNLIICKMPSGLLQDWSFFQDLHRSTVLS